MTTKKKPSGRHHARCCVMQALYQWQFKHHCAQEIIQQYLQDGRLNHQDFNFFAQLFQGTIDHQQLVDDTIKLQLDRQLTDLTPVELAILRLAVYELLYCKEVPRKVVINEAIEIAKQFGSIESYKYINGVLDKIK